MKNLIYDFRNFVFRGAITFGKPLIEEEHSVTYNFIRNIKFITDQFKPDKIFLALEGHPAYRYSLYPDYKATRIVKESSETTVDTTHKPSMREIVDREQKLILDLCKRLPVTTAYHPDYEADDVVNTLVHLLSEDENIVITGDTDYYQLLETSNCKVYNATKKVFLEKFKYPYVVHKALVGDKSDNIPRLISDKKAEAMLDNPDLLEKYLAEEEKSANFNINFNLIKFQEVPPDSLELEQNFLDMNYMITKWEEYKFPSLLKETYIDSFKEVFEKLSC